MVVGDGGVVACLFFERHDVEPPIHDAVGLGKETVGTHVHAVAFVIDGAGDAADDVVFFEDDGDDVGSFQELVGGG